VGTPTVETFKTSIKMNAIRNVNIAKKIFGADMSSLKGKLTCRKSTPVWEDTVKIPEELITDNHEIELCIDIMYVNECGFMTTIDRTIRFRSAIPIENRTHKEYYCVLDMVLRLHSSTGFHIKTIHCNREFHAIMEKVKDNLGVRMKNFTNALLHLNSGRVITWCGVNQIPIMDVVIKAIEQITKNQGFKTLKFKN
jgi:hypothetical protein